MGSVPHPTWTNRSRFRHHRCVSFPFQMGAFQMVSMSARRFHSAVNLYGLTYAPFFLFGDNILFHTFYTSKNPIVPAALLILATRASDICSVGIDLIPKENISDARAYEI